MRFLVLSFSVLCLDAPIVAIVWQKAFARATDGIVSPAAGAWLFLTAWLIYLADRIADSFTIPAGSPITSRQRFCREHRRAMILLIAVLVLLDAAISFRLLEPHNIKAGLFLGTITFVYFFVNHLLPRWWKILPLKEVMIGFLFAAGTAVAVKATASLFLPVFLFAVLCSLNCLSISFWERDLDLAQKRISFATEHPAARHLPCIGTSVAVIAAIGLGPMVGWPIALLLASSAAGLLLLNVVDRIHRDQRVAAADLVLLTPIIYLMIPR